MVDGSTELHRSLAGALRFAVLSSALALGPVQARAAKGVRTYACAASQGRSAWRLQRPDAALVGDGGERRGRQHGAGPSRRPEDGGTVVGTLVSSAPSPTCRLVTLLCAGGAMPPRPSHTDLWGRGWFVDAPLGSLKVGQGLQNTQQVGWSLA